MVIPSASDLVQSRSLDLPGAPDKFAAPASPWVGKYPDAEELADSALGKSMAGKEVLIIGGGEVYQQMYAPVFPLLGIKVHLYDPKEVPLNHGENKLESLDDAPKGIPAFILSPHAFHYPQVKEMMRQGREFACEKTICLPGQVDDLVQDVEGYNKPTYWIDFNHMMGRVLPALASGINMPFLNEGAIKIDYDSDGKIATAIKNHEPLIPGKIKKITGHYLQGGSNVATTVPAGSEWQHNPAEGGGFLGLCIRLFNLSQLSGLQPSQINTSELKITSGRAGEYSPVPNKDTAEHWAHVTGTMKDGIPFDFTVGKYAAKDEQDLTIEYESGDKLVLKWLPPNRKNSVEWTGADGVLKGKVDTFVDPYLLCVLEAMDHFANGKGHLYLKGQAISTKAVGQAAGMDRAGLAQNNLLAGAGRGTVHGARQAA